MNDEHSTERRSFSTAKHTRERKDSLAEETSVPGQEAPPRRQLTKAEVQQQMRARSDSIDRHLDGMEQETQAVSTSVENTVRRTLERHMFLGLGGVALGGLALGLLFFRGRSRGLGRADRKLIDRHLDAVREDVRAAVRQGEDAEEAVHRSLSRRAPVVVRQKAPGESKGFLREVLDLAWKTALGVMIKYAVDTLSETYLADEQAPDRQTREGVEHASEDAAPVVGAVSAPNG